MLLEMFMRTRDDFFLVTWGGGGGHALPNFRSRRNKYIFWVFSRKASTYLIIFSKKLIFTEIC